MVPETPCRPEVADLQFLMYDRPFHPELIGSLARRRIEREGYRLTLHLTAAGHLLEWTWQGHTILEVLGERNRDWPEHRQLFAHRVGGERNEQFNPTDRIAYQTCFQMERLPAEVFFHLHDELQADGEKNGVLHLLRPEDRLRLSPLSYVDLQARSGSLLVHVYHTYPAEFAVVKSQTLIEIASE